jgi:hypothetical protein
MGVPRLSVFGRPAKPVGCGCLSEASSAVKPKNTIKAEAQTHEAMPRTGSLPTPSDSRTQKKSPQFLGGFLSEAKIKQIKPYHHLDPT